MPSVKKKASETNEIAHTRPGSAKQVPAFFVPERNYKLLIMYILKTYGDNVDLQHSNDVQELLHTNEETADSADRADSIF